MKIIDENGAARRLLCAHLAARGLRKEALSDDPCDI